MLVFVKAVKGVVPEGPKSPMWFQRYWLQTPYLGVNLLKMTGSTQNEEQKIISRYIKTFFFLNKETIGPLVQNLYIFGLQFFQRVTNASIPLVCDCWSPVSDSNCFNL